MTLDADLHLKDESDEAAKKKSFLYKEWLKVKKEQGGYFLLANGILQYLPLLKSSAAMNLYLYYAEVANNNGGYSWHSIATISKKLQTNPRTINNWNKALKAAGLILRFSGDKGSNVTQLLPLDDFVLNVDHLKIDKVEEKLDDAKFEFKTVVSFYIKYPNMDHKIVFAHKKYSIYGLKCHDTKDELSFYRYIILEETLEGDQKLFKDKKIKKDVLYWKDDNSSDNNSLSFICDLSKEDELSYKKKLKLCLQLTRKGLISEYKTANKEKKVTF